VKYRGWYQILVIIISIVVIISGFVIIDNYVTATKKEETKTSILVGGAMIMTLGLFLLRPDNCDGNEL